MQTATELAPSPCKRSFYILHTPKRSDGSWQGWWSFKNKAFTKIMLVLLHPRLGARVAKGNFT
jgi:hypothetical protein